MRRVLFVFVTVFVGAGCGCGGCGCPPPHGYPHGTDYRNAEMADRQKKAQPVIDALKRYSVDHGKYPEKLDDLVAEKRLDGPPDLADKTDHQGESGRIKEARPLEYVPNADRSAFELRVDFTFSEFSMQDPRYVCTYSSHDGKWRRSGTSTAPLRPKSTAKN